MLQTAGEDKELELLLLKQRIYIEYLDHVPVYDEKTSQKDNLQKVILEHLDTAKISVSVAVAWFTDVKLFKKLLQLQENGIKVELIITNHNFTPSI